VCKGPSLFTKVSDLKLFDCQHDNDGRGQRRVASAATMSTEGVEHSVSSNA
jgi:hypothetical protein